MSHRFRSLLLSIAICVWSHPALAQVIPPSAESGRIEKRLERTPEPPKGDIQAPKSGEKIIQVPPGSDTVFLTIKSLTIRGVTVYSPAELAALGPKPGTRTSLAELYRLAGRIEEKYRSDGYILARVGVESEGVSDGAAVLKVEEGQVSGVRVETEKHLADSAIEGIVARVGAINPFNIRKLEREMLLLSDLFGVKAQAFLVPGQEAGTVGIEIKIEDSGAKRFQSQLSFDNYGSRYLGPYEISASEQAAALLLPHDRLTLSAFASVPPEKLKFGSASYLTPVGSNGTSVGVNASYGKTAPGFTLKSKDITGDSNSFGIDFAQSIIRSRGRNLNFSANIEKKEAMSQILSKQLYTDQLRTLKLGLAYDDVDAIGGANAVQLSTTHGFDILGASRPGSANLSRAEGQSEFTKFELVLSRSQSLPWDFSGLFSFAGQYTLDPLLSAEQFGYGGQSFGRAYDPSAITGDQGAEGLLELRYSGVPELAGIASQPYGFYDLGKVWNIHAGDESGASAGFGVRFAHKSGASANFSVAKPLTRRVDDPISGDGKSPRFLFSLGCVF